MFFSYGCGQQWIDDNEKCRRISGDFDCHADAALRRGAHRPMEHVQGFTGSHWNPPSGKCLRRIAPAAAMVNEFVGTTQNTDKSQLLASNYSTFRELVISENFNPKTNPLLNSLMRQASFKCETPRLELKSLRWFLAIKCCQRTKST
jgi:hypothetical protein